MLWILFLLSALAAYGVTQLTITLSLRRGVLDFPNVRSSHSRPVPRMGGIGILAGFYLSIAAILVLREWGMMGANFLTRDVLLIVFAGAGMALTGLCDDLFRLSPATKFLAQFVLASLIVASGARIENLTLPLGRPLSLGLVSLPITLLWLIGFSNIFNFMDGINGLAAVTGVIYSGLFLVVAWWQGNQDLAATAVLLAGSCLGFLFHNFPKARTFMGDTGSLFLGMVLALLVVRLAQRSHNPAALFALVLAASLYLWDSGFTLLRRLKDRENIFQAHRSHLYQRLVQAGLSHVKVTGLYLFVHAFLGVLALAYLWTSEAAWVWILALAALVFSGFTVAVYWLERRGTTPRLGSDGRVSDSSGYEELKGRENG